MPLHKIAKVFREYGELDPKGRRHFRKKAALQDALAKAGIITGTSSDQADSVIGAIEEDYAIVTRNEPDPEQQDAFPIWVCKHGAHQSARRSYTWRESLSGSPEDDRLDPADPFDPAAPHESLDLF